MYANKVSFVSGKCNVLLTRERERERGGLDVSLRGGDRVDGQGLRGEEGTWNVIER